MLPVKKFYVIVLQNGQTREITPVALLENPALAKMHCHSNHLFAKQFIICFVVYEYLFNFKFKKMCCIRTIAHAYTKTFGTEKPLLYGCQ